MILGAGGAGVWGVVWSGGGVGRRHKDKSSYRWAVLTYITKTFRRPYLPSTVFFYNYFS